MPPLVPWLPVLGIVGGASGGVALAFLLHYVLWGFGDWLLYPLVQTMNQLLPNVMWQQVAPLLWGIVGGATGILLGIGHAFASIGQIGLRYAVYVFLSLIFLAVLINAMLATGA